MTNKTEHDKMKIEAKMKSLQSVEYNQELVIEDNVDTEEILEKYDSGYNYRKKVPFFWKWFIFLTTISLSVFHLYTAILGTLPSNQQRGFHLALALGLIFLLYPANKKDKPKVGVTSWISTLVLLAIVILFFVDGKIKLPLMAASIIVILLIHISKFFSKKYKSIPISDAILSLLGFGVGLYHFFFYQEIISRVGMYNQTDFIVAGTAVLLVIEGARRVIGIPIVMVATFMLFYAHYGPHLPFLDHRGFSVERIISHSFLSLEGILGIPIAISATFIYLYMMFGVILQKTGLEEFFSDLAMSMTGWMTGGTAKVGVLTSVFSGTITGSSVANTVGNGAFTIPMMKRSGYKPEFAAAVEAASSTGGQIMPPIMGSAAFLMIEFTGLQYAQILKAAIIPALLFFLAQFIFVHYESKRIGIMGVPKSQLASLSSLLLTRGYLLLPIIAIIYILSVGRSPMQAAMWGIYTALGINLIVMILAFIVKKYDKVKYKLTLIVFLEILSESARKALPVIAACACAGIIVGVITLTGLGLRIAGGILQLAQNKLFLTMFFTMIASIILGMGLPTTANYVITATMAAPALLAFDTVPVVAAHLFVFYFGIVADITPPVALAAYAGSGIAQSNPFKTSIIAVKIAVGAFLVPYMFVLSPALVLEAASVSKTILAICTAILGMFCIGTAMAGFIERKLFWYERALLVSAGLGLLYAHLFTDLLGAAVFVSIYISQLLYTKKRNKKNEPSLPA
ncbi:TRAP transporter permease [Desulfitibacter alkalitolerans]|uniref:TRAP transporter permease n=1 Tax=Desulfitibacter alkalitolerans TaxID=264641 RepID=UPI000A06DA0A|nr:TRAP transporter permease [Desulfitibacter alkalitolerans]